MGCALHAGMRVQKHEVGSYYWIGPLDRGLVPNPHDGFNMKAVYPLALLVSACIVGNAYAETTKPAKPVQPMTMSCAEFLDVSILYQPAVVYWIASVDRLGVSEEDTIVVDDPTVSGYFAEECRKTPNAKLATKVKKAVESNILKINYSGA
jgi:acid stress chaperone HdeA